MKLTRIQVRKLIMESLSESFPQLFRNLPDDPEETEEMTRDLQMDVERTRFPFRDELKYPLRIPSKKDTSLADMYRYGEDDILDPFSDEVEDLYGSPEARRKRVVAFSDANQARLDRLADRNARNKKAIEDYIAQTEEKGKSDKEKEAAREKSKKALEILKAKLGGAEGTFDTGVLSPGEDDTLPFIPDEKPEKPAETTLPFDLLEEEMLSRGALIRKRWGRY